MTTDLSQFLDSFFEESFEALDSMEAALLTLDVGAPEPDTINTIFRVAHSIKGGSGMFGLNQVASFTHTLETLLDELRGKRMQVTQAISDLLLQSVDVLRALLKAIQCKESPDEQKVADLQFELERCVAQGRQPAAPASPVAEPPTATRASTPAPPSASMRTWRIGLRPLSSLLANGNDPLRLIATLQQLGDLEVRLDTTELAALADLDVESCTLAWNLELTADCDREVIVEIFDWTEGECEVSIEEANVDAAAGATAVPATACVAGGDSDSGAGVAAAGAPPGIVPAAAPPAGSPQASVADAADAKSRSATSPKAAGSDASSIRVSIERIDELINTVGEVVIAQSILTELGARAEGALADDLRTALKQLERNVRELQESVMRVRMLPISFVFSRFPRLVRDLSQRLGKQVELRMTGEQTELDKTVLERIGDPLVHLVRNSVDHGLETPDVRAALGKSPTGTVHLNAYHKGGAITIEVSDDGAGLNRQKILEKARARGLVGPNEEPPDEAVWDLIFLPGFSTAERTTDVSGRGVGMDVVRRNIKDLGGTIELKSVAGRGSRTVISLPLTLAIVDGQSVAVSGETYIVPLVSIIESLQLKRGMVNRLIGRGEVFSFRGDFIPLIRLHDLFGARSTPADVEHGLVMVVEGDGRKVGLLVDALLGQQQVVIKSLEANFRRVNGISGATVLGEGSVALILDVPGLVRVAGERQAA